MKQTTAPKSTPSPHNGDSSTKNLVDDRGPSAIFISMVLDMSWRLALAVLVPIVGGHYLDKHFDSTPLITVIGFIVAAAGMALVMVQTVKTANKIPVPKKEDTKE
jgi:F0F1-type ATP synthase assembly protein I